MIVTVCGAVLLIAAAVAVVVASRNRQQPGPPPDVPVAASPVEVRVKAVERKAQPVGQGAVAAASGAVAIVCGMDEATADRYEARNARFGRLRGGGICRRMMSRRCWYICAGQMTRCGLSASPLSRTT